MKQPSLRKRRGTSKTPETIARSHRNYQEKRSPQKGKKKSNDRRKGNRAKKKRKSQETSTLISLDHRKGNQRRADSPRPAQIQGKTLLSRAQTNGGKEGGEIWAPRGSVSYITDIKRQGTTSSTNQEEVPTQPHREKARSQMWTLHGTTVRTGG